MKGYKAFEKGMICGGKQYAENTVFEEEKAEICKSGMHFCKEPLDVLDYYPFIDKNGNITEFAEVEALDEPKTDDEKKFCTKKLKIGAKISFAKLVQASFNFEYEKVTDTENEKTEKDNIHINTSNDEAQIASSGNYARIGSSGHAAQIASSSDYARIGSSGSNVLIGSSGGFTQIGSSGYYAQIASSGYSAQIASSGNDAQIASSGNYARIASSGNYARIASSSGGALIGSSGHSAQITSSGDDARINSTGKYAVICCAGEDCIAKGKIGSWITLSEWEYSKEENEIIPVCVKTEKIDGIKIKEDTFYKLKNGKFVEVEERR